MNKELRIKVIVLFIILNSCFLILAPMAHAQQVRSFTISPPTIEQANLMPGQHIEGTMKLTNNSDQPLTFQTEIQDFIVSDTQGTPQLLPQNTLSNKYSGASWIGIFPDNFTLASKETEILSYFIDIPKDARPGGHYAAVIFRPIAPTSGNTTGTTVETQIGSLFYLPVAGNIYEHAQVSKFMAEHAFYEYGPVKILSEIQNQGDQHIKALGNITITNMLGGTVAILPLQLHNIFPGASREFENVLERHWMVGLYKVTLLASYGKNNNLPLMKTSYFWVIPWKIGVVIILFLLLILLGFLYWRKTKQIKTLPPSSTNDEASSHVS